MLQKETDEYNDLLGILVPKFVKDLMNQGFFFIKFLIYFFFKEFILYLKIKEMLEYYFVIFVILMI